MQERSEEQIISRLFELENAGSAERRAELSDERFLSLIHDPDRDRAYVFQHGTDETEGAEVPPGTEFWEYPTLDEATRAYDQLLAESGQAGEMIDLIDALQSTIHLVRIEHRTFDILHARQGACGSPEIEHSHMSSSRDERRDQVQPDEAGAASDEYLCHERGFGPLWNFPEPGKEPRGTFCDGSWIMTARSRLKPSAVKNFAITNIGPSNK